ncbi:MAG: thiamine pyrophosphate-dependent dehydrogenase E1 component subunit alpha [Deltaproteobacteria bacterium]|nr:thiamine pyrophosphate-dependent dehydrogenase E1 component subunit alpha [Deltaproteobacteria bacterium]
MKAQELYRMVSLIRRVELKIVEVYPGDVMQCPVHLSIGQEAIAAAVCRFLGKNDPSIGTHRSHALYLAKGGSPVGLFAELLGRINGCSGGYGGSMHLVDLENGLMGTTSIVGGALPISVGMAMGTMRPRIACVIFGDGACDEGAFYESLSFASLKKLPLLFVCENNRYSVYTHTDQRRCSRPLRIAEACSVRTLHAPIDAANDAVTLYGLIEGEMGRLRSGGGPLFIECDTVRALDHNGIRDDIAHGWRPAAEAELVKRYDPLILTGRHIDRETREKIDGEIRDIVESAYASALKSEPLNAGETADKALFP